MLRNLTHKHSVFFVLILVVISISGCKSRRFNSTPRANQPNSTMEMFLTPQEEEALVQRTKPFVDPQMRAIVSENIVNLDSAQKAWLRDSEVRQAELNKSVYLPVTKTSHALLELLAAEKAASEETKKRVEDLLLYWRKFLSDGAMTFPEYAWFNLNVACTLSNHQFQLLKKANIIFPTRSRAQFRDQEPGLIVPVYQECGEALLEAHFSGVSFIRYPDIKIFPLNLKNQMETEETTPRKLPLILWQPLSVEDFVRLGNLPIFPINLTIEPLQRVDNRLMDGVFFIYHDFQHFNNYGSSEFRDSYETQMGGVKVSTLKGFQAAEDCYKSFLEKVKTRPDATELLALIFYFQHERLGSAGSFDPKSQSENAKRYLPYAHRIWSLQNDFKSYSEDPSPQKHFSMQRLVTQYYPTMDGKEKEDFPKWQASLKVVLEEMQEICPL
jgi:hypothetical protein